MKSPRDLVLVFAAVSLTNAVAATGSEAQAPAYIGSEACAECHADTASAWAGSHHAWAWNQPSEATVLGDFDDAVVRRKGVITRFFRRDGRYVVETDGPDGRLTEYQVHSTAGVEPLQQILLETAPGRLQALDLAWDSGRQRWYDLYPDQVLNGGDGLHWTGPYKTWNARCAECHATGYRKNYDPPTRRYASTQAEKGVGCEACHGPGEAHAGWARGADPARWSGLTLEGFTIGFSGASAATEIQQCAGCHARRDPFGDGNPLPGTPSRVLPLVFPAHPPLQRSSSAPAVTRAAIRSATAIRFPARRFTMRIDWRYCATVFTTPTARSRTRSTSMARSSSRGCTPVGCAAAIVTIRIRRDLRRRTTPSVPAVIRRRETRDIQA